MSDHDSSPRPGPPNEQADPTHIGIKIKDQNKGEIFSKIKHTTKFGKIIKAYCDRQEVDPKTLRFLLDGRRIQDNDTPEGLDMEDGDMVDAMLEQVGGDATYEPEAEVDGAATEGKHEGSNRLEIKVKDQYNNEVFFMTKATTPLGKAIDVYCQRQGIERNSRRFLFEGTRIQDDQSPQALEMADGDCIDCFVEQEGGRGARDCPITFLNLQDVNSSTHLNLRIRDEHHNVLFVRTKRDLPLERALYAWCDATKNVFQDYVFLFKGTKVLMDRSARSVGMGDDNDILAVPNTYLVISVNYPPANKLYFKLRPTTHLGKLTREWCKRTGNNSSAMRFLFDGTRVKKGDTPAGLGMRNNGLLEAFSEPIQTVNLSVRIGNRPCGTLVPTMHIRFEYNSCLNTLKENVAEFLEVYGMSQYPFRLLFDGSRIQDDDTPASLDICDGDEIELWFEQLGGGDEPEDPQPQLEVLKLKVRNIYGSEVTFNVKPTTKLAKLRKVYANQQGQDVQSLRFCTSDGKRVLDEHTPEELDLEDGDIIDVFLEQLGGGLDSDNSDH